LAAAAQRQALQLSDPACSRERLLIPTGSGIATGSFDRHASLAQITSAIAGMAQDHEHDSVA
jgi:hypothetical protein